MTERMHPSRRRFLGHAVAGAAGAWLGSSALPARAQPPARLSPGQGEFWVPGGPGRERRRIQVRYFMPRRFTPDSPVLLVLPGGSRNAEKHLDPWIRPAQRHNLLVAALGYPAEDYNFAAYQLGGVVRNLRIRNVQVWPDDTDDPADDAWPDVPVRGEAISYQLEPREAWLFQDFDRIFEALAEAGGSRRRRYDLYGHSAGAQVVHRAALFNPASRAGRIVAANAGLYTLPRLDEPLIFGLGRSGVGEDELRAALGRRLTVMLGDRDRKTAFGRRPQRTIGADRQGADRFERGRTFFATGREAAQRLQTPFGWTLEVTPGVGHDHARMARAAARLLYG